MELISPPHPPIIGLKWDMTSSSFNFFTALIPLHISSLHSHSATISVQYDIVKILNIWSVLLVQPMIAISAEWIINVWPATILPTLDIWIILLWDAYHCRGTMTMVSLRLYLAIQLIALHALRLHFASHARLESFWQGPTHVSIASQTAPIAQLLLIAKSALTFTSSQSTPASPTAPTSLNAQRAQSLALP